MKRSMLLLLLLSAGILSCAQNSTDRKVGGPCEACDLMYEGMPQELKSTTVIVDKKEPGEPMIISGIIYQKDGKTPAEGVILYVYHTDNNGLYSRAPGQKENMRHGHLRGWMKTDEKGHYQFSSIRPAPYPGGTAAAHIHPLIKEPRKTLYWIDEYLFEDDPNVNTEVRRQEEKRGGSGIINLKKDINGVWVGKRDIVLGMNIPEYK